MNDTFDRYRTELDALSFPEDAKARMTARLREHAAQQGASERQAASTRIIELDRSRGALEKPGAASAQSAARAPKRSRRRILRYAAVAAVAAGLALGGTSAYAAATQRSLPAVFSDIFGGAPAQTEVIDKIGHPIGASATSDGVTMTADAVIGDASSLTVVFSIERDDGQPLADLTGLASSGGDPETAAGASNAKEKLLLAWCGASDFYIDGMSGGGGGSYFYDADPADPSIQFVWTWDNAATFDGKGLAGRTARVHFSDLASVADGYEQMKTVAAGSWDLKFELGYEDASVSLPAGQQVALNGMTATVDKVSVSPVGASLAYTVDAVSDEPMPENGYADELPTDKFMSLPFIVTFKDGHTEEDSAGTSDYREQDGKTVVTTGMSFDSVANMDDIVSVTVGDQVIPVN